ncbi:hypothetical protein D3C87_2139980 [compost metagenome]
MVGGAGQAFAQFLGQLRGIGLDRCVQCADPLFGFLALLLQFAAEFFALAADEAGRQAALLL